MTVVIAQLNTTKALVQPTISFIYSRPTDTAYHRLYNDFSLGRTITIKSERGLDIGVISRIPLALPWADAN